MVSIFPTFPTILLTSFTTTPPVEVDGLPIGTATFVLHIPSASFTQSYTLSFCPDTFKKKKVDTPVLSLTAVPNEIYADIGYLYVRSFNRAIFKLLRASLAQEILSLPETIEVGSEENEWALKALQDQGLEILRARREIGTAYELILPKDLSRNNTPE